jgi:hypothetical protein
MEELRCREALARARLKSAALGLKDTLVEGARRERRTHPWAFPIAGFCAGVVAAFLLPERRSRERAVRPPPKRPELSDAWAEARAAAAETLSQAIGAAIRRLLQPPQRVRSPEDDNGCSR